MIPIIKIE